MWRWLHALIWRWRVEVKEVVEALEGGGEGGG
jgi:hypothetical protein